MTPDAALAFLLLLFPTGRLRSRRWRPAAWFLGRVFTLTAVGLLVGATRSLVPSVQPRSAGGQHQQVLTAILILVPAALLVSVTA